MVVLVVLVILIVLLGGLSDLFGFLDAVLVAFDTAFDAALGHILQDFLAVERAVHSFAHIAGLHQRSREAAAGTGDAFLHGAEARVLGDTLDGLLGGFGVDVGLGRAGLLACAVKCAADGTAYGILGNFAGIEGLGGSLADIAGGYYRCGKAGGTTLDHVLHSAHGGIAADTDGGVTGVDRAVDDLDTGGEGFRTLLDTEADGTADSAGSRAHKDVLAQFAHIQVLQVAVLHVVVCQGVGGGGGGAHAGTHNDRGTQTAGTDGGHHDTHNKDSALDDGGLLFPFLALLFQTLGFLFQGLDTLVFVLNHSLHGLCLRFHRLADGEIGGIEVSEGFGAGQVRGIEIGLVASALGQQLPDHVVQGGDGLRGFHKGSGKVLAFHSLDILVQRGDGIDQPGEALVYVCNILIGDGEQVTDLPQGILHLALNGQGLAAVVFQGGFYGGQFFFLNGRVCRAVQCDVVAAVDAEVVLMQDQQIVDGGYDGAVDRLQIGADVVRAGTGHVGAADQDSAAGVCLLQLFAPAAHDGGHGGVHGVQAFVFHMICHNFLPSRAQTE